MTTEALTDTILDDFERLTSYDVRTFLQAYVEFTDEYSAIVNYYTGITDVVPTISVSKLNWLAKEKKKIIDVVILNSNSLENYKYWILCEYIDSIGHAIETAKNISRWSRSASTGTGYKRQVVTEYMLKQGQTLQNLERESLSSANPDGWVDTALQNELAEDDYTLVGGQLIKVIYKNNSALFLEGIVDNINLPEKTYGLDIDCNIRFDLATQDLATLGYVDTLLQSMAILTQLNQQDDPSFPDRGLRLKGSVLGGNVAGISYPTIFRDLAANFATDDSFGALMITDIKREQDAVYLEFTVETRTGQKFNDRVQV